MPTNAYLNYVLLHNQLEELVSKKLRNSPEAERINFLMGEVWLRLSETERERFIKATKLPLVDKISSPWHL